MEIKKLFIQGFKSLVAVELSNLESFIAFAGSNAAGKSNFMDALVLLSQIINHGVDKALDLQGGSETVFSFYPPDDNKKLTIHLAIEQNSTLFEYKCQLILNGSNTFFAEKFIVDHTILIDHSIENKCRIVPKRPYTLLEIDDDLEREIILPNQPNNKSAMHFFGNNPIIEILVDEQITKFDIRLDKVRKTFNPENNFKQLTSTGSNIANILSVEQYNGVFIEELLDWMQLIVPGLLDISSIQNPTDGTLQLLFKEKNHNNRLPTRLISDGTLYALIIITAILIRVRKPGITLIEAPERGLHPKAIAQLISLMREKSNKKHQIIITTYSESVIRFLKPSELWIVEKKEGCTEIKNVDQKQYEIGDLSLDKAWLSNFFDGGLPW